MSDVDTANAVYDLMAEADRAPTKAAIDVLLASERVRSLLDAMPTPQQQAVRRYFAQRRAAMRGLG